MEDPKSHKEPEKSSYVLKRMKRITSSADRAVKVVLYLWIASIVITVLLVIWYILP